MVPRLGLLAFPCSSVAARKLVHAALPHSFWRGSKSESFYSLYAWLGLGLATYIGWPVSKLRRYSILEGAAMDPELAKADAAGQELTQQSKEVLETMCHFSMQRMLSFIDAPEPWWDERRVVKGPGNAEIVVLAKQIAGFGNRVFLGRMLVQDAALEDVVLATEGAGGCRKGRFDPAIEKYQQLMRFESKSFSPMFDDGPRPWIGVLRSHTNPALLGLISKRVVDDVCLGYCRVATDSTEHRVRYLHAGIGVTSPLADDAIQQCNDKTAAEHVLEGLRRDAQSAGEGKRVVMTDHTSGLVIEEYGPRSFMVTYVIHSNPAGGLPAWAPEKAIPQTIAGFFKMLQGDLVKQQGEPRESRLAGRRFWPVLRS